MNREEIDETNTALFACEICHSTAHVKDCKRILSDCEDEEDFEEWQDEPVALCVRCQQGREIIEPNE